MKIYIVSKDEKPIIESIEIKGNGVNLRISDSNNKQDYFIGKDGKLKKIRNKKTIGLIDILIEGFKKWKHTNRHGGKTMNFDVPFPDMPDFPNRPWDDDEDDDE